MRRKQPDERVPFRRIAIIDEAPREGMGVRECFAGRLSVSQSLVWSHRDTQRDDSGLPEVVVDTSQKSIIVWVPPREAWEWRKVTL